MIDLTSDQFARLRANSNAGRRSEYLIKMLISGNWYYITDADTPREYGGATYQPGYLYDDDVDDIETTSEPKTNDINIKLQAHENSFMGLFLGEGWMNGQVTIYEHHRDSQGEIFTKNVYQGLIDDFSAEEEDRAIDVNIASIWADFEKVAGIKTNSKSQQRFYPTDTAFDHVSRAMKKIYWGKEAPRGTSTGVVGDKFSPPAHKL